MLDHCPLYQSLEGTLSGDARFHSSAVMVLGAHGSQLANVDVGYLELGEPVVAEDPRALHGSVGGQCI